jgi:hypothetical protein
MTDADLRRIIDERLVVSDGDEPREPWKAAAHLEELFDKHDDGRVK